MRWSVRPPAPVAAVAALSRTLNVTPALAAILWARGLHDAAPDHLDPPLQLSPNPSLVEAAARLEQAIEAGERILIHGDYDADGITGTAILLLGLRELGAKADAFIPDRLGDGYGVSLERVNEHAARADLFVTVDCGISNAAEVTRLKELGVDVIITDHHTPGETLPDALIVHPSLSPLATHGLPELTGAGVAFHLLWALRERLGLPAPLDYVDLAAIGTIADVAPLLGENRAIIKEGLQRMRESRWPGVRAVMKQARLHDAPTARDVAFVIGPRLNAAGRLGEADKGLALLTTASERQALELATYLEARNADRRKLQDQMFEHALTLVDEAAPALVLHDASWHGGVMGIVASKLLERYYRPVYLATAGKGSVRSTPGISAVGGLTAAKSHLLRFGGHQQAAGFALDMSAFDGFRGAIYRYVEGFPRPEPSLVVDAVITPGEVENGLYKAICDLEPFGQGHEAPLFALAGRLDAARAVGREGSTLQLVVEGIKGVAWQKGQQARGLRPGSTVNVAATLRQAAWQGRLNLEILAQEVRPAEALALDPGQRGEASRSALALVGRGRSGAAGVTVITDLVPAAAVIELQDLVAAGSRFELALDDGALDVLEREALTYPTVNELRIGLVALKRGSKSPFTADKSARVRTALRELGLLDERGHVRAFDASEKLSPYESPALLDGLLERYRLRNFVTAYRHFDDEAFAVAVVNLFGAHQG
ncbi:MAG TPA: single-stranded-DNA-specific exonuclease RecJ [Trueperaceae bacterium]|nr:single-stranded-DNA-specific exonuclease RecJ [Trueperaceae bacterium]